MITQFHHFLKSLTSLKHSILQIGNFIHHKPLSFEHERDNELSRTNKTSDCLNAKMLLIHIGDSCRTLDNDIMISST